MVYQNGDFQTIDGIYEIQVGASVQDITSIRETIEVNRS